MSGVHQIRKLRYKMLSLLNPLKFTIKYSKKHIINQFDRPKKSIKKVHIAL
jgi:hypothetical protein